MTLSRLKNAHLDRSRVAETTATIYLISLPTSLSLYCTLFHAPYLIFRILKLVKRSLPSGRGFQMTCTILDRCCVFLICHEFLAAFSRYLRGARQYGVLTIYDHEKWLYMFFCTTTYHNVHQCFVLLNLIHSFLAE